MLSDWVGGIKLVIAHAPFTRSTQNQRRMCYLVIDDVIGARGDYDTSATLVTSAMLLLYCRVINCHKRENLSSSECQP